MLEDIPNLPVIESEMASPEAIPALLQKRNVRFVSWEEWKLIDQAEMTAGQRVGRPRIKYVTVQDMIAAADAAIAAQIQDLLIVGSGPAGLYAAFYAGLRGMKARVLEALPDVGGQLITLYPEMDIYDVPGFMQISAKELVDRLHRQAKRFQPDVEIAVNCRARKVEREDGIFLIKDSRGVTHRSHRLIIASGVGAITPNKLDRTALQRYEGKGLHYFTCDKSELRGKRVLIVGGGDTALLWALNLKDWASEVTLAHRTDAFRAREAYQAELNKSGATVYLHHELHEIAGEPLIKQVTILDNRSGKEQVLAIDAIVLCLGFKTDQSFTRDLNLERTPGGIQVDGFMQTSQEGIYAIGDVAVNPDSINLKLIVSGVAQAVIAVNHVCHGLYPDKRLVPPHSSTLRL